MSDATRVHWSVWIWIPLFYMGMLIGFPSEPNYVQMAIGQQMTFGGLWGIMICLQRMQLAKKKYPNKSEFPGSTEESLDQA